MAAEAVGRPDLRGHAASYGDGVTAPQSAIWRSLGRRAQATKGCGSGLDYGERAVQRLTQSPGARSPQLADGRVGEDASARPWRRPRLDVVVTRALHQVDQAAEGGGGAVSRPGVVVDEGAWLVLAMCHLV